MRRAVKRASNCLRIASRLSPASRPTASLSTVLAGYAADRLGTNVAFMRLAGVAATGLVMILLVMPETRRSGR